MWKLNSIFTHDVRFLKHPPTQVANDYNPTKGQEWFIFFDRVHETASLWF